MFNRAKLLNVGYVEARKDREYDCYVFHDVDLLPLSIYNLYRCDRHPKHLSAVVDSLGSGFVLFIDLLTRSHNLLRLTCNCGRNTMHSVANFL